MSERNTARKNGGDPDSKFDLPKNSRLFAIVNKEHTDEVLRDHFSQFEGFQDIWIVKDRSTGERKGVAYVKYAKASQAGRAMDETDGEPIGTIERPVKVKVAQSRRSGSTRDFDEDEELTRIFILIPKSYTDKDVQEKFGEYGQINKVHQILDKSTGERKGFAYVKYQRMFEAATAIESCDPEFKAVWAEPRQDRVRNRDDRRDSGRDRSRGHDSGHDRPRSDSRREEGYESYDYYRGPPQQEEYYLPPAGTAHSLGGGYEDVPQYIESATALPPNATSRLQVDITGKVTEQQLHSLFNIVPGLEYCDFREETTSWGARGTAHVRYKSAVFAAYARTKMNGLQYPGEHPLMIQFMGAPEPRSPVPRPMRSPPLMGPTPGAPYLAGPPYSRPEPWAERSHTVRERLSCSVELPPPQPIAPGGVEVKERLFIVLARPLPDHIVQDALCRFGQLINYHTIRGKNYGFARYASAECAKKALDTLHGADINGGRIKVIIAEPETNRETSKRQRTD